MALSKNELEMKILANGAVLKDVKTACFGGWVRDFYAVDHNDIEPETDDRAIHLGCYTKSAKPDWQAMLDRFRESVGELL